MPSREEINKRINNEKKKSMTRRMRYIVPFSFCNEGYCVENVCNQVDEEGNRWVQTSVKSGDQDLYKFVLDSFADYGSRIDNSYVASSFMYQTQDGSPAKRLRYYENYYDNRIRKFNYIADFDIKELGLFLFGTGIGFLWYEISDFYRVKEDVGMGEMPVDYEMPLNKLYEFQFQFKELNRSRFAELFRCKKGEEEELFLMGNWIAGLLAALNLKVNFFAERENERVFTDRPNECLWVPDKAVLFSYGTFNEEKVGVGFDFSGPAYYLTKGYKLSYATPENVREQMRYPFRNVCFYAAQEGTGYFSIYNEKNYSNFLGNMYDKVMNDYFLMYILLLHQKYTIVKFRGEIGANMSAVAAEYSERVIHSGEAEKAFLANEELLDEMVTKLTVFIMKNMHTSVSHIHHQNDFYSYVSEQLEIQKECSDLSQGVRVLRDSLESKRAKYEAAKEGKRDRKISVTLSFVSWIAFISTLFSMEDFINKFWVTETQDGTRVLLSEKIYIYVLFGFMIFFVIVSAFLFIGWAKQSSVRFAFWKSIKEWCENRAAKKCETAMLQKLQCDSLTGLQNMRYFVEVEESLVRKSMKPGKCLLVAMVDVNGLDEINSKKGRNRGDDTVKDVAKALDDIAGKYEEMEVFRKEEDQFFLIEVLAEGELKTRMDDLKKVLCPENPTELVKRLPISCGFADSINTRVSPENGAKRLIEKAYFELLKMKESN